MLYCPVLWVTGGQRVLEKLPTSDYSLKVHPVSSTAFQITNDRILMVYKCQFKL